MGLHFLCICFLAQSNKNIHAKQPVALVFIMKQVLYSQTDWQFTYFIDSPGAKGVKASVHLKKKKSHNLLTIKSFKTHAFDWNFKKGFCVRHIQHSVSILIAPGLKSNSVGWLFFLLLNDDKFGHMDHFYSAFSLELDNTSPRSLL